jgi:hypothetical protein
MNDDSRIYVEAGQPATLNDGSRQADRLRHLARGRLGLACAALSTEDTGDGQGDWRPERAARQLSVSYCP